MLIGELREKMSDCDDGESLYFKVADTDGKACLLQFEGLSSGAGGRVTCMWLKIESQHTKIVNAESRVVTCVYCGHEYPQGTGTWNDEVLTEHIKICPKHPMREAEAKIKQLERQLMDTGLDARRG